MYEIIAVYIKILVNIFTEKKFKSTTILNEVGLKSKDIYFSR